MSDVTYTVGIPDEHRRTAATLYDVAFGSKLRLGIADAARRIEVIDLGMDATHGIAALYGGDLVGVAGYDDGHGSLTGGIGFGLLRRRLGWARAIRAVAAFTLLERRRRPGELLMDGIVVAAPARGRGIGTGLLACIEIVAAARHLSSIRLDVVDTNPGARRLYERKGFGVVKTERLPVFGRLMGFSATTTMVKRVAGEARGARPGVAH